jgi:hypothetical protein
MAIGINLVNALTNPQNTVQMGEASHLDFYKTFFSDVVSKSPALFIIVVVLFEIIMGLLILNKHRKVKIGLIGTSIFLFLITPFGYIQIPWLGIAGIQLYLLKKDFDKTFIEIIISAFRRDKK